MQGHIALVETRIRDGPDQHAVVRTHRTNLTAFRVEQQRRMMSTRCQGDPEIANVANVVASLHLCDHDAPVAGLAELNAAVLRSFDDWKFCTVLFRH